MTDEELERCVEKLYELAVETIPLHPQGWWEEAPFKDGISEILRRVRLETARACAEECEYSAHFDTASAIRARFGLSIK